MRTVPGPLLWLLLFFLLSIPVMGQERGGVRSKQLVLSSDTLKLDTLSLVPGSIRIANPAGEEIDSSKYTVLFAESIIIFDRRSIRSDSLSISYKTFPFDLSKEEKHKDVKNIGPDLYGANNPFSYTVPKAPGDLFKTEGLNKSGSISRGIAFGNNQDVSVNSNLNLQLSGKLTKDIDILVAASDDNIPIQPEGNTQQLQEFDKVFIQLSDKRSKLIAGDFVLAKPTGYFMNMNKRSQGLNISSVYSLAKAGRDTAFAPRMFTTASAAVSKGKFARNQITGVEGNQGPYRLRGAENELFIIVLSGTERVYIDGMLLQRGQEYDYVIDYNTAEITFTPRHLITKDKRIIVEFQYSDKNYARSLIHVGNGFSHSKTKLRINVFSEQDSKNQPLQQELTDDQKLLLHNIGDTLSLAVTPSYDTASFSTSEVLYERRDTIVNNITYQRFVYSTNADSILYRVTFSSVGYGNGNYRQATSSANGRVFEWVAPVNGVPQGSYEPVIQLITPKKKQMVTFGLDHAFSKNSRISVETALSNNDINTFSPHNSSDDVGFGIKMNFDHAVPVFSRGDTPLERKNSWKLITNVNYELVQKYFSPIERFRSVEFERDWNRGTVPVTDDQHIAGAGFTLAKDKNAVGYRFNAFFEGGAYNATRHIMNTVYNHNGFSLIAEGSYLDSRSLTSNTGFIRHRAVVSQKIRWFTIGAKEEQEVNRFRDRSTDTLQLSSFAFYTWEGFIQNADTSKIRFNLSYRERTDQAPRNNSFLDATHAQEASASVDLVGNPRSQFRTSATYRKLNIRNEALTAQRPDDALVGRAEYTVRAWKGAVMSSTFYEIGSGLELKREFIYLKVADGQGVYEWIDYNTDSIPQLNEFEVAVFKDRASYIKVYTPTNEYVKTFTNQLAQTLTLRPLAIWNNERGFKKLLTRFSNQASYRVDRKTSNTTIEKAYNPFLQSTNDSTLVSLNSSVRNTFFFNQSGTVFGADITWQDIRNKALLTNGFDSRVNTFTETRARWNITKKWTLQGSYKNGRKISRSEYFSTRDYEIIYNESEPRISFQPGTSFRASLIFRYVDKRNSPDRGGQHAVHQDYGTEIRYSVLSKGSFNAKFNYINISYNDSQNTPLAFEMLSGLKAGENYTWGVTWDRTLSNNLQLSLTYDGRKSPGVKSIHTGGAQVRAFF